MFHNMYGLYNLLLYIANLLLRLSNGKYIPVSQKTKKFIANQHGLLAYIEAAMKLVPAERPIMWFHASSYGEYNIARPIIRQLRENDNNVCIVLTFFSPTGVDMMQHDHSEVDYIFPLPLDTHTNVVAFLQAVRPVKVFFLVAEYWVNYLTELKRRQTPTYLLSAAMTGREPFFRWYGSIYRRALTAFTHIFALNDRSRSLLKSIGFENVSVVGDPLFDSVMQRASQEWHNEIVERFVANRDVFICGSIHNDNDLRIVAALANQNPYSHFLIVPHEISEEILHNIMRQLEGHSRLYSECSEQTDFSSTQTLIIDFMGSLAYLYRYARWAYVGGGFSPYLHNVLEATAYGIPVAFGPRIERKPIAQELISEGIGATVSSSNELNTWFESLKHSEQLMQEIKTKAKAFMQHYRNSTNNMIKKILSDER